MGFRFLPPTAFLFALAMGSACRGDGRIEIPASDLERVVITMERTVDRGFGSGPAYVLTIYGDGTVEYEGIANVAVEGKQRSKISQDDVRELVVEFYEMDYFSLRDRYECLVTDQPSTTTSISIGGTVKSVFDLGVALEFRDLEAGKGAEGVFDECVPPRELRDLEGRIDEITSSSRWIEGE